MNDRWDDVRDREFESAVSSAFEPMPSGSRERVRHLVMAEVDVQAALLRGRTLFARAAALAAALSLFAGAAYASATASPGQALYGVRRAIETVRTSVVDGKLSRGARNSAEDDERQNVTGRTKRSGAKSGAKSAPSARKPRSESKTAMPLQQTTEKKNRWQKNRHTTKKGRARGNRLQQSGRGGTVRGLGLDQNFAGGSRNR